MRQGATAGTASRDPRYGRGTLVHNSRNEHYRTDQRHRDDGREDARYDYFGFGRHFVHLKEARPPDHIRNSSLERVVQAMSTLFNYLNGEFPSWPEPKQGPEADQGLKPNLEEKSDLETL